MSIISFENVTLSYGTHPLLDGVSFRLEAGERVCLVGRNGAGKSTLLKIISAQVTPDAGQIRTASGLRIAELAQELPADAEGTTFQVVAAGLGEVGALVERYHRLTQAVAAGADQLDELERCQHQLESAQGWSFNQRVESVLSRLNLDPEAEVSQLSGGIKRRVMLARALVAAPDLLLLDEPTNHLDIDAIAWLEQFLLGWDGSLVFITHDRAFLQRLATRILELDRGQLVDFPGDYTTYLERKEAMLAEETRHNALLDKRLAQEEAWIRQGVKARRKRNQGRVRALQEMRQQRAERRQRPGSAQLSVQTGERSGRLVAEALGAGFDHDGQPVINGLTTTIMRGDKVGIIGPNGAGKTTLLRLLLGELTPTRGKLRQGTNLQVAYFDQHRAGLQEHESVQQNVSEGRDMVTINGQERHVLSYLKDFLFTPERARQPVSALSGGERSRLLLARLFTRPANVLVLDEPTNDLDSDTLELLEERLVDFPGTVLLVSHDRAFLNNVVTSVLAFEAAGTVNEYVGGYDDWLRQRPAATTELATPAKPSTATHSGTSAAHSKKLSYKEKQELDSLPERIEALEAERDRLQQTMTDPGFYQRDKTAITRSQARLAELEEALEAAYARWQELES